LVPLGPYNCIGLHGALSAHAALLTCALWRIEPMGSESLVLGFWGYQNSPPRKCLVTSEIMHLSFTLNAHPGPRRPWGLVARIRLSLDILYNDASGTNL